MKRLLILSTILLGGVVVCKAPPTLQGPTLSGSGGGLTSNQVYQIAVTVGGPYAITNKEGGIGVYYATSNNSVATIGGAVLSGNGNTIGTNMPYSVIAGGSGNTIPSYDQVGSGYDFIGGGAGNRIVASEYAFIGSGSGNLISSATYASILGGHNNTNAGFGATVYGGNFNNVSGTETTVGGLGNQLSGDRNFALGHANYGNGDDTSLAGYFGSTNSITTGDGLVFGNALTNTTQYTTIVGYHQANLTFNHTANTATLSGNTKFVFGSGATITSGTGAPSASEPNGSIYLRTDGSTTTTLYVRISGAWVGK